MDLLTITAASGLRARMESLDLLANNLSNSSTAGYKADREFYNLYASADAAQGVDGHPAPVLPVVERNWVDHSQGLLHETRNPLDVALEGRGFFVVNGPNGPLYTRNGALRVSIKGLLETQEGYPVRAVGTPRTIQVSAPPAGPLEVRPNGEVWQDSQLLGRMQVQEVPQPETLEKRGAGYFALSAASVTPVASTAHVHQGKLEASNTGSAEAAVRLISVMRQFEMLQRAVNLGGEMNRRATEDVARVGG